MSRFSIIQQKLRETGSDLNKVSDPQKLMVYFDTLKVIEEMLLETDARKFTESSLEVVINDLSAIIMGINGFKQSTVSRNIPSIEGVIFNLRSARNELYVASDMVSKKRTISYYRCIDKARDFVESALSNLR